MWRNPACVSMLVCMVFLTGACNTVPFQNKPLAHYTQQAGYRYTGIAPGDDNSDSLCVIVTFSGGGTRAAAFSFGVLEKLRDTEIVWEGKQRRLLDEVDIISSVSGGSLPSAYYGLFGDRIFEDFPDKVLYRNIQGNIVTQVLSPANWPKLVSPFYGRSDMIADDFSRKIFEDKTFADLLARNQRPFIVINATDVSLGSRFDFTQRQFDLLYSDLASFPVGRAVAASAAFPGLLTPVTLRNYPKQEDYAAPAWVQAELENASDFQLRHRQALEAETYIKPGRPFIHLSDGGVSDNLGLLPVIQLLGGSFPGDNTDSTLLSGSIKKVVIITVNAKRVSNVDWDTKAQVLGLFKVLGVGTSVPLGNFSEAEVALTRLWVRQYTETRRMRDRIIQEYGEEAITQHFPELAGPDVDYHFIEVDFDQVPDETERAYLNDIPTAFKLKREQVDRLREAAAKILDSNADYQQLLDGLE
ncbi:MAG TPA: patatin-like phospholipase family protein [Candidatus Hydrogenedentes bacterium]|nr:patatin-like phospholipase family protein [Candidatus Hydrogenedentota bacterium]